MKIGDIISYNSIYLFFNTDVDSFMFINQGFGDNNGRFTNFGGLGPSVYANSVII